MWKFFLAAAALVVAGVPAAYGLAGNDSFTRDVPVRVPEQAQTATPADAPTTGDGGAPDHQGRGEVEPGDDRGTDVPHVAPTPSGHHGPGAATSQAEPGDHHGDSTPDHGDSTPGTSDDASTGSSAGTDGSDGSSSGTGSSDSTGGGDSTGGSTGDSSGGTSGGVDDGSGPG